MVAKVAQLHFLPASPVGALRALSGWLIVLTGLALLIAQLAGKLEGFDQAMDGAIAGGAMAAAATALGALPLLVMRRISAGAQGMLLGFGAGVMLAASVFSLLLPAFAAAQGRAWVTRVRRCWSQSASPSVPPCYLAWTAPCPTTMRRMAHAAALPSGCSYSRLRYTTFRKGSRSASPQA